LEDFQPLAFLTLINAACGWRWVWSIDGMILAGKNRSARTITNLSGF
jgi:hypothetical protein